MYLDTKNQFAVLLMDDQYKDTHVYRVWKDIFPLLCGSTVEELAAQTIAYENRLFGFE